LPAQLPEEKLRALPSDFNFDGVETLDSITVKSTCYRKGLYVVLAKEEETTNLIFGEIDTILLDAENKVSFILKEKLGINSFNGYYKLQDIHKLKYQHVLHQNLIDYYPLPAYTTLHRDECITLKHSNVLM